MFGNFLKICFIYRKQKVCKDRHSNRTVSYCLLGNFERFLFSFFGSPMNSWVFNLEYILPFNIRSHNTSYIFFFKEEEHSAFRKNLMKGSFQARDRKGITATGKATSHRVGNISRAVCLCPPTQCSHCSVNNWGLFMLDQLCEDTRGKKKKNPVLTLEVFIISYLK